MMTTPNAAVSKVLKRLHYPLDVILMCVRWYVAYPLSLRHLEEMMAERGIAVDIRLGTAGHLSCYRYWGRYFSRHKRSVGKSWRMDATYIRVKGEGRYLHRAVDKDGNTIDFLLRAKLDKVAARRFIEKSIARNCVPETVTIDKSGAILAALEAINTDREMPIRIRQSKYLNNLVEQDHREMCVTNVSESLRCCIEDGSRSPEIGLQELVSNHPILLHSKGVVVNTTTQVSIEKMSESEPSDDAS